MDMRGYLLLFMTTLCYGNERCFYICKCDYSTVSCRLSEEDTVPKVRYIQGLSRLFLYGHRKLTAIPDGTIPPNVFRLIQIMDTGIQQLPCSALLGSESVLYDFRLINNPFLTVPECVGRMANLRALQISNSLIETLKYGDFVGKKYLQTLDLSYNLIMDISVQAFSETSSLTKLILRGNKLSTLKSQQFTQMGASDLELLDLSHNEIEVIPFDSFDGISVKLHALDISYNRITQTTWTTVIQALTPLTELCALNVSGNPLASIEERFFLQSFPSLYVLGLSECSLSAILSNDFRRIGHLDVSRNAFSANSFEFSSGNNTCKTFDSKAISFDCSEVTVNVSDNHFNSIRFVREYDCDYKNVTISAERSGLQTVTVILQSSFPNNDTIPRPSVDLRLKGNRITGPVKIYFSKSVSGQYTSPHSLKLDLSENRLSDGNVSPVTIFSQFPNGSLADEISPCNFSSHNIMLDLLDLSGNGITTIPTGSCILEVVEILKLNRNSIHRITSVTTIFRRLRDLELRENGIEFISDNAFTDLHSLRLVDLRDNELTNVPASAFALNPWAGSPLLLKLDNNPLHCDCNLHRLKSLQALHPLITRPYLGLTGRCVAPDEHKGFNPLCFEPGINECPRLDLDRIDVSLLNIECQKDSFTNITHFSVTEIETGVQASWRTVGPGIVYGYHISYKRNSTKEKYLFFPTNVHNITIENLPGGEIYNMCIRVIKPERTYGEQLCGAVKISISVSFDVLVLAIALGFVIVIAVGLLVLLGFTCSKKRPRSSNSDDRYSTPGDLGDTLNYTSPLRNNSYLVPQPSPTEGPPRVSSVPSEQADIYAEAT